MGEGLNRKRLEQFQDQLNESIEEKVGAELLDRVPPVNHKYIDVVSTAASACEGVFLSARLDPETESVQFIRGQEVWGSAGLETAAQLGARIESIVFKVLSCSDGVLRLQVVPADRWSVRPSTDGDFDD